MFARCPLLQPLCRGLPPVFIALALLVVPGAALAQDGYVTLRGTNKLLIYDPANPTEVSNVTPRFVGNPSGVAVSPDGNDIYVIVGAAVHRVNDGRTALDPTPIRGNLSGFPEQIVVSPDGTKLFVTAFFGKLHIIDLVNDDPDPVDFGFASRAWGVDAVTTPFGDRVYVSLPGTDEVKVFDAASSELVKTVSLKKNPEDVPTKFPQGVAASPLGDLVYVANFNDNSVSVINVVNTEDNTEDNSVIATIPAVGSAPQELAVSADGTRVYVTLRNDGKVAVIDTTTDPHTVLAPVGLGTAADSLHGISFSADGAFVVVAHFGGRKVSRINPADSSVVPTPALSGSQPRYVAFQPLAPVNTPAGSNIEVTPSDTTTPGTPVSLTFENVTDGGHTTLATALIGPPLPPESGFVLGEPPMYFDISSTAEFDNVSICIDYSGMTFQDESALALWHFDGTSWENATTSRNTTNKVVCGTVSSLSVFVVAEPEPLSDNPPSDVPFLGFQVDLAKVNTKGRQADSFWFNGNFTVDTVNGNDIDPASEAVVIDIEGAQLTIPAGEFEEYGRGRLFRFRGFVGSAQLRVHISHIRGDVYNIDITGWTADIPDPQDPVELCLKVGDDFGCDPQPRRSQVLR